MADETITVEFEFDGRTYVVEQELDPTEEQLLLAEQMDDGRPSAMFALARSMGADTTGWKLSKVGAWLDAVKEAQELSLGEGDGSQESSASTPRKSSTRSSSKA